MKNKKRSGQTSTPNIVDVTIAGDDGQLLVPISSGADVNAKNSNVVTLAMWAARYGRANCIQIFVTAGYDLDARDNDSRTAAMWAATSGSASSMQVLADAGADLNVKSKNVMSAIMLASRFGRIDCMDIFVKAGVDLSGKSREGRDVATMAAYHGHHENASLITFILNSRAESAELEKSLNQVHQHAERFRI